MPDDRRFSDEEIDHSLGDLGARIEYPTTPDVAHTVRRKLDEEERSPEPRRTLRWPPFLAPRWMAVMAAVVVICVVALSPTPRTTLSGPFAPAPRPVRMPAQRQDPRAAHQGPATSRRLARLRKPQRRLPQTREKRPRPAPPRLSRSYRHGPLPGRNFDSTATTSPPAAVEERPQATWRFYSGKTARPGGSRPSMPTRGQPSTSGCVSPRAPSRDRPRCRRSPTPVNARRGASWCSDDFPKIAG